MTEIQPVHGIPALRVGTTLVIADLHIGLEAQLVSKGFHITSRTEDMFDAIMAASDGCNKLIVLGDVKNSVPGSSKQEYREIPDFFCRLSEHFNSVTVVRGNHDTNIEEFVPGAVRIYHASGTKIGDVGLIHGHTWPSADTMSCRILVMGHEHPTALFKDGVGAHMSEPCWMRGRFRDVSDERYPALPQEFILVPAFNRLLGGSPVNVIGGELLGPLMNSGLLDLEDAHLYTLDGIDLGRRADLMVKTNRFKKWNDSVDRPRHDSL